MMLPQHQFSVYDKATGKMYYPGEGNVHIYLNASVSLEGMWATSDCILRLCTAQADREGAMLYEGDLIQDEHANVFCIQWCDTTYDQVLGLHPIDKGGCHMNHFYGGWRGSDFKKIGTVHENPELFV